VWEKVMKRELLFELIIYVLSLTLAALLWHRTVILMLCYVVISIVIFIRWHTKSDLFFYGVAFGLGPIGESAAIYFGAWEYSKPFYLIPIWLPLLWGIAAVLVKNISETLLKKRVGHLK
jgi:hypothetical protein